ncbi:MAG: GH25 family lysozyme [Faecalimonas sp.]|nr:GH25 family lysozyme [Faecalimonas sp.]
MRKWKFHTSKQKKRNLMIAIVAGVLLLAAIVLTIVLLTNSREEEEKKPSLSKEELDKDPEKLIQEEKSGEGADVDVAELAASLRSEHETEELTFGIDVAKYQGKIDWQQVAASGIDFAIVRVGYRTMVSGEIVADATAKYNMQEASKYGIRVGAYFFSSAVSEAEAIEEANWVADYISQYQITYPVAYNCEGFDTPGNRQYGMTKTQRTDVAMAFLKQIEARNYIGMFYASANELANDTKWETSRIEKAYKIWVAQYPMMPYPQTEKAAYDGIHAMWQHTNYGTIAGIGEKVDVNVAYFGYDRTSDAQNGDAPEVADVDEHVLMDFQSVEETVTAKEKTNLRDKPSQGADSKVLYTLSNGETATRTGISNSGWSRVVFNGNTYYAVSSYLTTDLSYQVTPPPADTGFQTKFTAVNEAVTAKEEVNLRTMPSVTDANSQVVATIRNGEVITRTGINAELGFSRVEYNGQVLYCVSSYLMSANE